MTKGQSVQRAGAAAGKLMKGLVDPSKPKRIRIRKRDVSAPPRAACVPARPPMVLTAAPEWPAIPALQDPRAPKWPAILALARLFYSALLYLFEDSARQCRNNTASASTDGRRSTAASVAARASATTIASAASAGTARERRGASTIASGPRKFRPACVMPCLHPGAPYAQAVAALLAWVISACSLL